MRSAFHLKSRYLHSIFLATSIRRLENIMTLFFHDNTGASLVYASYYSTSFASGFLFGLILLGWCYRKE